MSITLGAAFDNTPIEPVRPDPIETLSLRLLSAIEQLQAAVVGLRPAQLPAPVVNIEPPDLTDIVTAVVGLKPGPTSEDIAKAIADTLKIPEPQSAAAELAEVAEALKKLDFRLQGVGKQAYGGGSVSLNPNQTISVNNFPTSTTITGEVEVKNDSGNPLSVSGTFFQATQPVSNTYLSNQTGTWGYKAGVSGTPSLPAGARVLGVIAHATVAGSMTINGGDSIPIPANVGLEFEPHGNLVAPTLVFTGTDTYAVEYVT